MKDIVTKILKEEEIASKTVEKARHEAENIVLQARKEADELVKAMTIKNRELAQKKKEETEKEFLSEKEKILSNVKKELLVSGEKKQKDIPEISKKIFERIIDL